MKRKATKHSKQQSGQKRVLGPWQRVMHGLALAAVVGVTVSGLTGEAWADRWADPLFPPAPAAVVKGPAEVKPGEAPADRLQALGLEQLPNQSPGLLPLDIDVSRMMDGLAHLLGPEGVPVPPDPWAVPPMAIDPLTGREAQPTPWPPADTEEPAATEASKEELATETLSPTATETQTPLPTATETPLPTETPMPEPTEAAPGAKDPTATPDLADRP